MWAANQLVTIGLRIARVACRTLANCLVVDHPALGMLSAGTRKQARVEAFENSRITSLVCWTVVICGAFSSGWLTSCPERLPGSSWLACTMVTANVVMALSTICTWEGVLLTLVHISADSVMRQNESFRADTEANLAAVIDTLLVVRARVRRCAVDAGQDAKVIPLLEWAWAATAVSQALQVARALVVVDAGTSDRALHIGVSSKSTGAEALWAMVDTPTFGTTSTDTRFQAGLVALLREGVAGFVVFAISVVATALDTLAAAPVVRISYQVVGAVALEAARQVATSGAMRTGSSTVKALIDIFTFVVDTHVACTTMTIFCAFRQGNQATAISRVASITGQTST